MYNSHVLLCGMGSPLSNFSQISHNLLLRALASLKSGVKSGTAEHKEGGSSDGMVSALVSMATFCDRALRVKEDEGMRVRAKLLSC